MNNDLDFRYINKGQYADLSRDERMCISHAQNEMLAVSVRVFQVSPNFNGAIKGNIATIGRETILQEIDPRFTPDPKIPHLMLHKKSNLIKSDVQPGDEVVIRYADGLGKIFPVAVDAKYAYDIECDEDSVALKRITEFLARASDGGKIRLTSDKIAEVVGNAITNAHFVASIGHSVTARPERVSVAITEYIKTIDLKQEAISVSEKLLKAHSVGYRIDLQESLSPQVVFVGAPKTVSPHIRG